MRILYTHRTQGVGAEGVHIMGMVEAFRELGHSVEMDGLPGCDPFEKNRASARHSKSAPLGAPGDQPVTTTMPSLPDPSKAGPPAKDAKADGGPLRHVYRLISDHAPQWVFGCVELLYNAPLFLRLLRKMRATRPDLVYERYALGNFAPALLCRLMRVPLMLEVNDSVVIERSRPLSLGGPKKFLEHFILGVAAVNITISERFKTQVLAAFPIHAQRILVCPNAVNEKRFVRPPEAETAELRRSLGIAGSTVLGSAGQFVPWHGLAPFVTAMAPLARERNLAFLFIGDGPVRAEVQEAAKAAGIEGRVHFTGMIPHALVPAHLAALDMAVIPFSNIHGSPMKLMEFMAMGLPVVAPDLPPIREVLVDGRTGSIFPRDDMTAMRDRLDALLKDREAAREMGRRARDHVLAQLTWTGHARHALAALAALGPTSKA